MSIPAPKHWCDDCDDEVEAVVSLEKCADGTGNLVYWCTVCEAPLGRLHSSFETVEGVSDLYCFRDDWIFSQITIAPVGHRSRLSGLAA